MNIYWIEIAYFFPDILHICKFGKFDKYIKECWVLDFFGNPDKSI